MCGEQLRKKPKPQVKNGSSPRVRGTGPKAHRRNTICRFIPACAGNSSPATHRARHASVHPRVCGEQLGRANLRTNTAGSSPRVRGTACQVTTYRPLSRFIPACAGNSHHARPPVSPVTVHPRVCGEQGSKTKLPPSVSGSSPRVRGTVLGKPHQLLVARFIPACAGNSRRQRHGGQPAPVHPRVCGEQGSACRIRPPPFGSSPRVRGTATSGPTGRPCRRFIPACAGNRSGGAYPTEKGTVHPRVCGEQLGRRGSQKPKRGSSPRVRGTGAGAPILPKRARFIPACAGNSSAGVAARNRSAVHPRVCGEQPASGGVVVLFIGSSPRVRGTDHDEEDVLIGGRFIPACAGNSRPMHRPCPGTSVHPRVCGEQEAGKASSGTATGSSPRVRGTGGLLVMQGGQPRFIPACAGNSRGQPARHRRRPVHPRVCGEQRRATAAEIVRVGSSPRVRGTG